MSDDDLNIKPDAVKSTGHQLTDLAGLGRSATETYFDAQAAAAAANPGFASGPKAVAYASKLHGEMNSSITDLQNCASGIIAGAQSFATTDQAEAAGFNRLLAALNGLTKPALPGR